MSSHVYTGQLSNLSLTQWGSTAAAAPLPFRPGEPAFCGSHPLVTPYYCRLRALLCLFCVYPFLCPLFSVHLCILLFGLSFVAFPSVLWYCWLGLLTRDLRSFVIRFDFESYVRFEIRFVLMVQFEIFESSALSIVIRKETIGGV